MSIKPEIRIVENRVVLEQGGQTLTDVRLDRFVTEMVSAHDRGPGDRVLPRNVRMWVERNDAVGVVLEVQPGPRTVRWLDEKSREPYGPGAKYGNYYLSFPYVVVLLVFRRGALTGLQQLYFRTASLDEGEDLLLPNLYNVSLGYGQRCWVCLQNVPDVGRLSWPRKIAAVEQHLFSAAFNKSSEVHEMNSYWGSMKGLDPRFKTAEEWQAATRENPYFSLDVGWKPAETTASKELRAMLDRVIIAPKLRTAEDLTPFITRAVSSASGKRRR
jgi:hypothetical protein